MFSSFASRSGLLTIPQTCSDKHARGSMLEREAGEVITGHPARHRADRASTGHVHIQCAWSGDSRWGGVSALNDNGVAAMGRDWGMGVRARIRAAGTHARGKVLCSRHRADVKCDGEGPGASKSAPPSKGTRPFSKTGAVYWAGALPGPPRRSAIHCAVRKHSRHNANNQLGHGRGRPIVAHRPNALFAIHL